MNKTLKDSKTPQNTALKRVDPETPQQTNFIERVDPKTPPNIAFEIVDTVTLQQIMSNLWILRLHRTVQVFIYIENKNKHKTKHLYRRGH